MVMRFPSDDEMAGVRVFEMVGQMASTRVSPGTSKAYANEVLHFLRLLADKYPAEPLLAAARPDGLGDDVYPPATTYGRVVRDSHRGTHG